MTNKHFEPNTLMGYVKDFHTSARMPVRTVGQVIIPEQTLRSALIDEEVQELNDAFKDNDFIEVIDALADIAYVAAGAAWCHGMPHLSLGDVIIIPNPETVLSLEGKEDLELYIKGITKAAEVYIQRAESGESSVEEIQSALEVLIRFCYTISTYLGVNLDDVLAEVQSSNMSKFDKDGNPYLNPETGKVMKGPDFFRPDLNKVIFG